MHAETEYYVLGIIGYILCCILICKGMNWYREKQFIQEVQQLIRERQDDQNGECIVLFIPCTSPSFKKINRLITAHPDRMAVVLAAPDWFVRAKQSCWWRHHVFHADELPQMPDHLRHTTILYGRKARKVLGVDKVSRHLSMSMHK